MLFLVVKYALTAGVVVAVSEVAKRSDRWGAILAALPLVTVIAIVWMGVEGVAREKIIGHAWYTFWFVLPTLPMFLLMPWLMTRGWSVGWALLAGAALTAFCFVATAYAVRPFGIELMS
jgi:hypothetical protein